jgi:hypothetical protein
MPEDVMAEGALLDTALAKRLIEESKQSLLDLLRAVEGVGPEQVVPFVSTIENVTLPVPKFTILEAMPVRRADEFG